MLLGSLIQDALIGSLLRLIQRMSSTVKKDSKEDKGLKKALCPALAIPDDPTVRVGAISMSWGRIDSSLSKRS